MGLYLDALNKNFKDLVTSAGPYVDKSLILSLINQNIKRNNKYICITRPCRFVKSLTASMLTAYYSKAFDSHFLFDNLKIAKDKTILSI